MFSAVAERYHGWLDEEVFASPLHRFRVLFALIWGSYDLFDIVFSGTHACMSLTCSLTREPSPVVTVQYVLLACEIAMLAGWVPWLVFFVAAAARAYLAFGFFRLNDFLYYIVTAGLLGVAYLEATPFVARARTVRKWILDVIRVELGFIYVATSLLKMNPSWLSGGHLYVRLEYLKRAYDWPLPAIAMQCAENARCASVHAYIAVSLEMMLGLLLIMHKAPRISLLIALAIHLFAVATTNVWFFGFSMIAQVACFAGRPQSVDGPPIAA